MSDLERDQAAYEVRYVRWLDSSGRGRWTMLSELSKETLCYCDSVGYVLAEYDDRVVLIMSLDLRADDLEAAPMGDNVTVIPKVAILDSITLRAPRVS